MKNSKYWEERFLELKKEMLSVTEKDWEKISNIYAKTIKGIEKEIAYWYQRYSKDNKIDYLTAVQKITSKEFKDFKVSLDDYIAMGEASNYTNIYNEILEKASSKYHITRLELLKFNLLIYSDNLHAEFEKELGKGLKKLFSEQYYKTAYEIQRGLHSAKVLSDVNTYALDVLQKPWFGDGEQFSSRIWKNRDKLAISLERELTHAFIRGDNPNRLTDRVAFLFKTSQSNSARLLQTEYAAISSTAQEKVYQDLDVEEFIFIATLDMRTSKICQDMDGHHFPMKDYKVGINAPPLHPRCRSCTAPYFPDMTVPRWARGEDGKSYIIDENITYKEWKEKYVDDKIIGEKVLKSSDDTLDFTQKSTKEALSCAKERIEYFSSFEPKITEDLKTMSKSLNSEMVGLDYRLKSEKSLTRKILDDAKLANIDIKTASEKINDILRYTVVAGEENFTDHYFSFDAKLKEKGYNFYRVKNTFKDGVPYKGINTLVQKDGVIFELQFHTPHSVEVKEIIHKLYEKQRVLDKIKNNVEYNHLQQAMVILSSVIDNPVGVERIR